MKSKSEITKGDKVIVTKRIDDGHHFEIGEIVTCVELYNTLSYDSFINEKGDQFSLMPEEWEYYEDQEERKEQQTLDRNHLAKEFLNLLIKGGRNYNSSLMVWDAFDLADNFIKQANNKQP